MKKLLILVLLAVLVLTTNILQKADQERNLPTREVAQSCIPKIAYPFLHMNIVFFHIHPELEIFINNEKIPIPANIGIVKGCAKHLHTHDETGKLHVEALVKKEYTLSDFFAVWEKDFSSNRLLDNVADGKSEIIVTVNGIKVETYENTILKDKDKIVIEYRSQN